MAFNNNTVVLKNQAVKYEYRATVTKYGVFYNTLEEGYGVLYEEYRELLAEINKVAKIIPGNLFEALHSKDLKEAKKVVNELVNAVNNACLEAMQVEVVCKKILNTLSTTDINYKQEEK